MPWKERKPMDERLRFVTRVLEGEKMAPLCREFGIARVKRLPLPLPARLRRPRLNQVHLRLRLRRASLHGVRAARRYESPEDPDDPFHDRTIRVTRCGRICLGSREINLSVALAEQLVGIREVDDQVWQVSFLPYDLGHFDRDQDRVEPGPNAFAPDTVSIMRPE